MPDLAWGLDPEQVDAIFPFAIAVDEALVVRRLGPAMHRLMPGLLGEALLEHLQITTPADCRSVDALVRNPRSLVLLRAFALPLLLRGQALAMPGGGALVLGAPWVTSVDALRALGLSLDDYAVHEPLGDFLFLIQAKNVALAEAERVAGELVAVRGEKRALVRLGELQGSVERELARGAELAEALSAVSSVVGATYLLPWGDLWRAGPDGVGRVSGWGPSPASPPSAGGFARAGEGLFVDVGVDGERYWLRWGLGAAGAPPLWGETASWLVRRVEEARGRRAERVRLAESEAQVRAWIEGALDPVVTVDQGGRIRDLNPAAERATGRRALEVAGLPIEEVIRSPSAPEAAILHRDGRVFPVELSIVRLERQGEPVFALCMRERRAAPAW